MSTERTIHHKSVQPGPLQFLSRFLLKLKSKENLMVRHTVAVGLEKSLRDKPFREDWGNAPGKSG